VVRLRPDVEEDLAGAGSPIAVRGSVIGLTAL
jgi:hypothetical protein